MIIRILHRERESDRGHIEIETTSPVTIIIVIIISIGTKDISYQLFQIHRATLHNIGELPAIKTLLLVTRPNGLV